MATATPSKAYVPPHLRNRSNAGPSPSRPIDPPPSTRKTHSSAPSRQRTPWSPTPSSASSSRMQSSDSAPGPSRRPSGASSAPSLYVFGDSFVGPMKLLSEDCVRIRTFKGSSAKGLNNPNSIKQVSRDLLPALDQLLAPPPYAYVPSSGRWAMLVFGNINYLWQLANKPLTSVSKPDEDGDEGIASVLATATETSATGPALGPEAFVESVVKAYTTWLQREIIDGPIGKHLTDAAEKRAQANGSPAPVRRKAPPTKLLIAAALPPLIEDEMLPRIPEKYVERLEEDHSKAQRAMERASSEGKSRTPWAKGSPKVDEVKLGDEGLEIGLSTMVLSDQVAPGSPQSSVPSAAPSLGDSQVTSDTASTPPSPPSSASRTKTPISELLEYEPPLCTLPVRVRMTNLYNTSLREYCERYPDILQFIDITPAMKQGSEAPSLHGEVDRTVWACPVDRTNVHPLWEPTLPLWKDELGKMGLPVDSWTISEDAEETFKAYELDKRRRTDQSGFADGERIKLRDE